MGPQLWECCYKTECHTQNFLQPITNQKAFETKLTFYICSEQYVYHTISKYLCSMNIINHKKRALNLLTLYHLLCFSKITWLCRAAKGIRDSDNSWFKRLVFRQWHRKAEFKGFSGWWEHKFILIMIMLLEHKLCSALVYLWKHLFQSEM